MKYLPWIVLAVVFGLGMILGRTTAPIPDNCVIVEGLA